VSGKSQVDGDGPERQKLAIKGFGEEHGVELPFIWSENGVSGTVEAMDRPTFSEILEYCDRQNAETDLEPIDAIIVERLDRLARDLMIQELLLRECRTRGIKVFAVDQGRMGAIAQWEKSQIVKKLGSARARIKARTGRCEGRKPFGEGKDLHEKRVLTQVLAMYDQEIKSRFIANVLALEGLMNPATGKPYTKNFINRLIRRHRR
jgi:DNA invertase Pin-like site-specific DNA recombinase